MRIVLPKSGKPVFSKRRRRFEQDFAPHELTFSCYKLYPFLARPRVRKWFVDALEQARQKHQVDLWAWVLMPEHVHLIVSAREPGPVIGKFQATLKERVARQAIQWLEEKAPNWVPKFTVREGDRVRRRFWQPGGGYDRNIESVETLYKMLDYIHLNPVRRGLVQRTTDWEWSSARYYAEMDQVLVEMDRTIPSA
jgi:putative transposase